MKLKNYQQIIKLWQQYWDEQSYFRVQRKSIISNDKSLLFVNSGISALKKYFIEQSNLPSRYLYNIQPCIRLNDLTNIGKTNRHNCFFEMLGHFSIGVCNKALAIKQAVQFLCGKKWMNLDITKIYVTVYEKDDDSYNIWQKYIAEKRIIKNGRKENFWQIGRGPCGPNTEIFYKLTSLDGWEDDTIGLLQDNIENNIYLELWNIVFSEFNYLGNNKYEDLKHKSVDVGAGLERLLTVTQNKGNIFKTSLFTPLIKKLCPQWNSTVEKNNNRFLFRICDFARVIVFLIADGVTLSSKAHGSILKKFIRMLLLEMMNQALELHYLQQAIQYFVSYYANYYSHLSQLKPSVIQMVVNYANALHDKFRNFWAIYLLVKKLQTKQGNDFPNFFEKDEIKVGIFEKIKHNIYPEQRFQNYSTFGTWQPEFQQPFEQILSFILLKFYKSYQYSILMPPPNITGSLHLGHTYELFIQDAMIREQKLSGFNTIWFAGFDHGGIATQIKINEYIMAKQQASMAVSKKALFNKCAQVWKEKTQKEILNQWESCGFLIDHKQIKYTLDPNSTKIVDHVFRLLFENNYIYRDYILVNYDEILRTVISDVEVGRRKKESVIYDIKYQIVGSTDTLVIATSRPETIFADEYIALNPQDPRWQNLVNKFVINPLNGCKIPIICDKIVDLNFGSGILKVTPGHDFNDFKIGKKHPKTRFIQVIDKYGLMTNTSTNYDKMPYLECRKKIVAKLAVSKRLVATTKYIKTESYNLRTNNIVTPLLSSQWFLAMKKIANDFLKKFQNNGEFKNPIDFFPTSTIPTISDLLSKTNDWCISRQIEWGQQIPIAYRNNTKKQEFICTVNTKYNKLDYTAGNDVFDTWFTSCMWPLISTKYQNDDDFFTKYYPITLLITGYDILFIWVIRMILLCFIICKLENKTNKRQRSLIPFRKVLIHGLIRDQDNLKMSKSNNNGVEPLAILQQYGNDAVRLFFLLEHKQAQDIQFQATKVKDWNEYLLKIMSIGTFLQKIKKEAKNNNNNCKTQDDELITNYLLSKYKQFIVELHKHEYNFYQAQERILNSEKYKQIFSFMSRTYSGQLVEQAKYYLVKISATCTESLKQRIISILLMVFSELLILLHPVCPFITEYWFQLLNKKSIFQFQSILTPKRFNELLLFQYHDFATGKRVQLSHTIIQVKDNRDNDESVCVNASIRKFLSQLEANVFYNLTSSVAPESAILIFFKSVLFAKKFITKADKVRITSRWINYSKFYSLKKVNVLKIQKNKELKTNSGLYYSFELLVEKSAANLLRADINKAIGKMQNEYSFLIKKYEKLGNHLSHIPDTNKRRVHIIQQIKDCRNKITQLGSELAAIRENWDN